MFESDLSLVDHCSTFFVINSLAHTLGFLEVHQGEEDYVKIIPIRSRIVSVRGARTHVHWSGAGCTKFTQLHVVTSQFVMFISCALLARIEAGTGSRHVNLYL